MEQVNPLSPAAQAVLKAANGTSSWGPDDPLNDAPWIAAAALRALIAYHPLSIDQLLHIANELEDK